MKKKIETLLKKLHINYEIYVERGRYYFYLTELIDGVGRDFTIHPTSRGLYVTCWYEAYCSEDTSKVTYDELLEMLNNSYWV